MSIAAKITSITDPNGITIGEDVYNMIHPTLKTRFKELKNGIEDWKQIDRQDSFTNSIRWNNTSMFESIFPLSYKKE
jgi:hypothetical protein